MSRPDDHKQQRSDFSLNISRTEKQQIQRNEVIQIVQGYKEQMLTFPGEDLSILTPPEREFYEQCRQMPPGSRPKERAALFYEQAQRLVDLEDDYAYTEPFVRYYPTYRDLNPPQLRGYISLRTRLRRREVVRHFPLSFLYIHIYELLMGVGVDSPEDGYETLQWLKQTYGRWDPPLLANLEIWLRDYRIYYDLPGTASYDNSLFNEALTLIQALEDAAINPVTATDTGWHLPAMDTAHLSLTAHYHPDLDETDPASMYYAALQWCSGAAKITSPMFRKDPALLQEAALTAFQEIAKLLQATHVNRTMTETCFGKRTAYPCQLFRGAIFHDHLARADYRYRWSSICDYTCLHGIWQRETYAHPDRKSEELAALLQEVDRQCREKTGFGHPLQDRLRNVSWKAVIGQVIDRILERRRAEEAEAARPHIDIDMQALSNIRQDAAQIRDALIVEEQPSVPPACTIPEAAPADISSGMIHALSPAADESDAAPSSGTDVLLPDTPPAPETRLGPDACTLLRTLLDHASVTAAFAGHHVSLPMLVDAVNEYFYDEIGDTVIEFDGDTPILIEDYRDEVASVLA